MTGLVVVKSVDPSKKLYKEKILNEPHLPRHELVIAPIIGLNGDRYFYLRQMEEGIQIM